MENWDVYGRDGQPRGYCVAKGTVLGAQEYQLAIEAWFVAPDGHVLIQQRSMQCEQSPGIWSVTAGRVQAGESSLQGCLREVREELGLSLLPSEPECIRRIVRTDGSQHIWDVYRIPSQAFDVNTLCLQQEEVTCVRWVSAQQFRQMLRDGLIFAYPEILEILDQVL